MQEYQVKVYADRTEWYQNGQLHRDGFPAIEKDSYGAWYQYGKLHRVDGPAVEWDDGDKCWYQNGQRHRLDGPAVEYSSGSKLWYIDDIKLTETEFNAKTKSAIEMTVAEIEKLLGYSIKVVK